MSDAFNALIGKHCPMHDPNCMAEVTDQYNQCGGDANSGAGACVDNMRNGGGAAPAGSGAPAAAPAVPPGAQPDPNAGAVPPGAQPDPNAGAVPPGAQTNPPAPTGTQPGSQFLPMLPVPTGGAVPAAAPVQGDFDQLYSPSMEMCGEEDIPEAKACKDAVTTNEQQCNAINPGNPAGAKTCIDGLQGVGGMIDPQTQRPTADLMREVMSPTGTWNNVVLRELPIAGHGHFLRINIFGAGTNSCWPTKDRTGMDGFEEGMEEGMTDMSKVDQPQCSGGFVAGGAIKLLPWTLAKKEDASDVVADLGFNVAFTVFDLANTDKDENGIEEKATALFMLTGGLGAYWWPHERFGIGTFVNVGWMRAPTLYTGNEGFQDDYNAFAVEGELDLAFHVHDNVSINAIAKLGKALTKDRGVDGVNNDLDALYWMIGGGLEFSFVQDPLVRRKGPSDDNIRSKFGGASIPSRVRVEVGEEQQQQEPAQEQPAPQQQPATQQPAQQQPAPQPAAGDSQSGPVPTF